MSDTHNGDAESVNTATDMLYNAIVTFLNAAANACVPRHTKNLQVLVGQGNEFAKGRIHRV